MSVASKNPPSVGREVRGRRPLGKQVGVEGPQGYLTVTITSSHIRLRPSAPPVQKGQKSISRQYFWMISTLFQLNNFCPDHQNHQNCPITSKLNQNRLEHIEKSPKFQCRQKIHPLYIVCYAAHVRRNSCRGGGGRSHPGRLQSLLPFGPHIPFPSPRYKRSATDASSFPSRGDRPTER